MTHDLFVQEPPTTGELETSGTTPPTLSLHARPRTLIRFPWVFASGRGAVGTTVSEAPDRADRRAA